MIRIATEVSHLRNWWMGEADADAVAKGPVQVLVLDHIEMPSEN
jgi:hypothetical protein